MEDEEKFDEKQPSGCPEAHSPISPNALEDLLVEKQKEIVQLRNEKKQLENELSQFSVNFSSLGTKKFLCKGQKQEINDEIQVLDKDIEFFVKKIVRLRLRLEIRRLEYVRERRFLNNFREKMVARREYLNEIKKNSKFDRDLIEIRKKIEEKLEIIKWMELNVEEVNAVVNGKKFRSLDDDFARLSEKKSILQQEIEQIEKNKLTIRQHQTECRQQIDVLKKRNSAQITRLKNKIAETKRKNDVFRQRAFELEQEIFQLKQK